MQSVWVAVEQPVNIQWGVLHLRTQWRVVPPRQDLCHHFLGSGGWDPRGHTYHGPRPAEHHLHVEQALEQSVVSGLPLPLPPPPPPPFPVLVERWTEQKQEETGQTSSGRRMRQVIWVEGRRGRHSANTNTNTIHQSVIFSKGRNPFTSALFLLNAERSRCLLRLFTYWFPVFSSITTGHLPRRQFSVWAHFSRVFGVDYLPTAGQSEVLHDVVPRAVVLHVVVQGWTAGGWSSSLAGQGQPVSQRWRAGGWSSSRRCRTSCLQAPRGLRGCSPAPSSSCCFPVREVETLSSRTKKWFFFLNTDTLSAVMFKWKITSTNLCYIITLKHCSVFSPYYNTEAISPDTEPF